jgi:ComEC/Rec2-like protein
MYTTPLSAGKTPFLRFLLPLIAGIVCSEYAAIAVSGYFLAGGIGIGCMLLPYLLPHRADIQYRMRHVFGIGLSVFIFSFGGYLSLCRQPDTRNISADRYPYALAEITEMPRQGKRSLQTTARIIGLQNHERECFKYERDILLYFQPDSSAATLRAGSRISFRTGLQPIRTDGNPDSFDFARYMRHRGIVFSQYLPAESWLYVGETPDPDLKIKAKLWQQQGKRILQKCRLSERNYTILCAMLLGDSRTIDPIVRESFSASGLSHILAVSGLHVGIIAGLLYWLFFPLRHIRLRRIHLPVTLLALWGYAFLTGLSASTVRATIMATFVSGGSWFRRRNVSLNALFASGFFMLLYSPSGIFQTGFQMSFLAVTGILLCQPLLEQMQRRAPNRILRYLYGCIGVSVAAQLGALPVALYYFHTLPLLFLVANLLVLPLLPAVMGGGILLFLCQWLFGNTGILSPAVDTLLNIIMGIASFIEQLPGASIRQIWIPAYALLLYFVIALCTYLAIRTRKGIYGLSALSISVAVIGTVRIFSEPTPQYEICIFESRSGTTIHWKEEQRYYLFQSEPTSPPERIPGDAYRLKSGIQETVYIDNSSDSVYYLPPFCDFYGYRMFIADGNIADESYPNDMDFLVITRHFDGNLRNIILQTKPAEIIFTADIPKRKEDYYIQQCAATGCRYHSIRRNGYWSYPIWRKRDIP